MAVIRTDYSADFSYSHTFPIFHISSNMVSSHVLCEYVTDICACRRLLVAELPIICPPTCSTKLAEVCVPSSWRQANEMKNEFQNAPASYLPFTICGVWGKNLGLFFKFMEQSWRSISPFECFSLQRFPNIHASTSLYFKNLFSPFNSFKTVAPCFKT